MSAIHPNAAVGLICNWYSFSTSMNTSIQKPIHKNRFNILK